MTTRADLDRLARGGSLAVAEARRYLEAVFSRWDGRNPEQFRDLLLEFTPALVAEYGDAAATVAAEWYEDARAAQVGGRFYATTSTGVGDGAVQGSVRYAAGHLFTDAPDLALGVLAGAVQRHILYSSRDTVARNIKRDPRRPRFARVPRGAKTCAWCSMLASRGFVYLNEQTAGIASGHYHDDCDCQVVAEWDRHGAHIEGYDPDEMFAMYQAARQSAGTSDQRVIAAELRRLFPESFTDGVIPE